MCKLILKIKFYLKEIFSMHAFTSYMISFVDIVWIVCIFYYTKFFKQTKVTVGITDQYREVICDRYKLWTYIQVLWTKHYHVSL